MILFKEFGMNEDPVSAIPRRQHLAKKNNPREYFLVDWVGGVVVGLSAKWDACSTQGTTKHLCLWHSSLESQKHLRLPGHLK